MTIYLVPKPPDRLGRKHRETGWRSVPYDREARKELESRVEPLRDKGIGEIHCSDLDTPLAAIVRDKLNGATLKPDFQFRRFNVGRHHAAAISDVDRILEGLVERWKKNPDVPMRGGDSLTSFQKRFIRRYEKLLQSQTDVALLVDMRTLSVIRDMSTNQYSGKSLCPNGNSPKMDRIYKVDRAPRT